MTLTPDELLESAIRDAQLALSTVGEFDKGWKIFVAACNTQQFDVATVYGQRLVALVETAVDLYHSSNRRVAQFEKLNEGDGSEP